MYAAAAAEAEALSQAKEVTGGTLYDLACVYALTSIAAGADTAQPQAERDQLAECHAARAVEMLAKARMGGFFKERARVEHLMKDPDLVALRSRDDFKRFVTDLEQSVKGRGDTKAP